MSNGKSRLLTVAARDVDGRSSRSKQRKVGASEIGVCRRRAGYSHHGIPYSDPENVSGIAAVLGTWIHKGALATMQREWGTIIEQRVENDLIRGHVDGIDLPNDWRVRAGLREVDGAPDVVEVDDLKTKRDGRMVAYVRNRGPKRSELFQTHIYGDLLRRHGVKAIQRQSRLAALGPLPVERVRLRYFARNGENDDDVQEYVHEQEFDEDIAREAWSWVAEVAASTAPEDLPRDQDGPGLSITCDNCPFLTACWGEAGDRAPQSLLVVTDADMAAVLAEYDEARTIEREAKARKDKARAMLDASEPAIYTNGADVAFKLHWTGGRTGDPKVDVDAMIDLFEQAKITVPYLEPRPSARTIALTRWEVPDPPCAKPVGDPHEVTLDGLVWLQDQPRGGWTSYARVEAPTYGGVSEWVRGEVADHLTAGQFAKRFPDYVDPRPPCVLKKAHSGDCWPDEAIHVLDVHPDDEEAAPGA